MKTFPSQVSVTYHVALTEYDKIRADGFLAIVDFADVENNLGNKLKVKITRQPKGAYSLRIHPRFVEFLIEK